MADARAQFKAMVDERKPEVLKLLISDLDEAEFVDRELQNITEEETVAPSRTPRGLRSPTVTGQHGGSLESTAGLGGLRLPRCDQEPERSSLTSIRTARSLGFISHTVAQQAAVNTLERFKASGELSAAETLDSVVWANATFKDLFPQSLAERVSAVSELQPPPPVSAIITCLY